MPSGAKAAYEYSAKPAGRLAPTWLIVERETNASSVGENALDLFGAPGIILSGKSNSTCERQAA